MKNKAIFINTILLIIIGLTGINTMSYAQPINDNPSGAITVVTGTNGSLSLPTNATVTSSPGAPTDCSNSGTTNGGWGAGKKDVWYVFVPTAGTTYSINTVSSSDLQMAIYTLCMPKIA